MHNNAHSKRASFWKSLIATAAITLTISCNTEARVTREVAEATIPYLLEAVGIPPSDVQATNIVRRDAIVHMLYTDAGQREMWNWAVNNHNPGTLTAQFQWPEPSSNIVYAPNAQPAPERIFQLLFPRGPSTFSSYTHHPSRLGRWVLHNAGTICQKLLRPQMQQNANAEGQIRSNLLASMPIDTKLACVLFVLDICDTADHIKNTLTQVIGAEAEARNNTIDQTIADSAIYNQYNNRPISATAVAGQGDCVQTLYRHLINIAIQNDRENSRNFNVGHLPAQLRAGDNGYYNLYAIDNVITVPITATEAGLTDLNIHRRWNDALRAAVDAIQEDANIDNGAVVNIATVLEHISPHAEDAITMEASTLGNREGAQQEYLNTHLNPLIDNAEDQMENATRIQNALNALDGRCDNAEAARRFNVRINTRAESIGIEDLFVAGVPTADNIPNNVASIIEIADRLWNRRIIIGIWAAGHAEIISIIPQ